MKKDARLVYYYHTEGWHRCLRCGLYTTRLSVVLAPYAPNVFVSFIGLGPGKSEDVAGKAFIGQSGRLLDVAVKDACDYEGLVRPVVSKDNLVACRPTDSLKGDNRDPTGEEAWACWPRLKKTIEIIDPKLIVLLGDTTKKLLRKAYPDAATLHHPAYILRKGGKACPDYRIFFRQLGELFVAHGLRRKAWRKKN